MLVQQVRLQDLYGSWKHLSMQIQFMADIMVTAYHLPSLSHPQL